MHLFFSEGGGGGGARKFIPFWNVLQESVLLDVNNSRGASECFSHKILQFALPLVTYTKSLNHFKAGKDVLLVYCFFLQ